MDTVARVPAHDEKTIYAYFNPAVSGSAGKAVILAHGLTGHPNEYIHQIVRRHFNAQGYDVYRIAFYGRQEDARQLEDCTLAIHASDLNQLVHSIRSKYKRLFCAGHSYGGMTLLLANPDIDAASFWDSSFTPYKGFWEKEAKPYSADMHIVRWGTSILIGNAMIEEGKAMDSRAEALAAVFKAPAQVVLAGIGAENPIPTHLFDSLKGRKELVRVEKASHCFYEDDSAAELAAHTQRWFESQKQ